MQLWQLRNRANAIVYVYEGSRSNGMVWCLWFDYAKVFQGDYSTRMDWGGGGWALVEWTGDAVLQHTKCVFLTECDVAGHWIRYGKH